ncbi:hypothetical protein [Mucilaginibacter flavidus]|uniref:hypothetical protein n=1 Tax=Mucilaginibacter flavidus TaxID=2949309 RepID=UPI00209373D6|nr:hypothetical protein [Mucilaginibacter flavidus]MCO5947703.1 hypothetical protein [Mucilaginibacter flavidus]
MSAETYQYITLISFKGSLSPGEEGSLCFGERGHFQLAKGAFLSGPKGVILVCFIHLISKTMKTNLRHLIPFFLSFSLFISTSGQAQTTDLYSGYTQTNSKYVSQYVPGFSDALINYAATINERHQLNYANYLALIGWLNDIITKVAPFEKDFRDAWASEFDQLVDYGKRHQGNFSMSAHYLSDEKDTIIKYVQVYNTQLPGGYFNQAILEF